MTKIVENFINFVATNTQMEIHKKYNDGAEWEISATVKHEANPPASEAELDALLKQYPNIPQAFIDLYRQMNGVALFACEQNGSYSFFDFVEISQFQEETNELRS